MTGLMTPRTDGISARPAFPPRRTWISKAAIAGLAALSALLVAEGGLRIGRHLSPRLDALLYVPTVRTEYDDARTTEELLARGYFGHQPFGVTRGFVLNSRGFRTHEYRDERSPGTVRMIALGDSFTFDSSSVPLGQMWHQVAGDELERSLALPVEVINLGQPAVGPRFELRLWELEGRRLEPDFVVLAFFVGNDFIDESGVPLEPGISGHVGHASYLWRLVRNRWRLAVGRSERRDPRDRAAARVGVGPRAAEGSTDRRRGGFEDPGYPETYDPTEPSLAEDDYLAVEAIRLRAISGADETRFRSLCREAGRVIERLARDVEVQGARFLLMVIPDESQVDPVLRARLFDPPIPLDVDRPQRCLRREMAERGIAVLDLLPLFRRWTAEGEADLYRPRDTHWTALGNRLAGRTLARHVVERGLLDDLPRPDLVERRPVPDPLRAPARREMASRPDRARYETRRAP